MRLAVATLLLLIISVCSSLSVKRTATPDPDCFYNITELIQHKGFPCEEHKVVTNDGYILGVFRIRHGRNSSSSSTPGRPVLLQHGLLDSAATWVVNFPDQSLAYILADAGYDVWLGNMRGNRYSRAHTKYNPDRDQEFWNFSWDDMSHEDLPSMINYILNVTNHAQVAYVGHSQGTLIAFAEFGRVDSVVKDKVSFWTALAPVAQLGHIISPLKYLSPPAITRDIIRFWHLLFGTNEFLPESSLIEWLGTYGCTDVVVDRALCENILFVLCGPEAKNLNASRISVIVAHEPGGTSVQNMIHFAQAVQSNKFEAYDYGSPEENRAHYNQTTPPLYTLRPMTIPTAIFWGGEDWLADPTDVTYIFDNVKSLVYEKYIPNYNHIDFVWAITANKVIYEDLIAQMRPYHPPN